MKHILTLCPSFNLFTYLLLLITHCSFAQSKETSYVKKLKSTQNQEYSGFKGAFSVSDNGAALYDIPFPVTPGVGGMTPRLSLSYNSGGTGSILGEGWSLSGFSFISRSPNRFVIDSVTRAIAFDSRDKLSLDGTRLISYNPDDVYGSGQTEYRTENDEFKKVVIEESVGQPVDGIRFFKVQAKDGLEYYYGSFNDNLIGSCSGIVKTSIPDKSNIPYLWLLTLIKDRNGNWIKFEYDIQSNFYKPLKIIYGARDNASPIGQISFSYYDEGSVRNRWNWQNEKYIQGERTVLQTPLETITSFYINKKNERRMVRTYKIDYDYDNISNKLLLSKITQWVKTASSLPLINDINNAVIFDWNKNITNNREFKEAELIETVESPLPEENFKVAVADFNGDGFPDKIMHKNYGDKILLKISINDSKGLFINEHTRQVSLTISKNARSYTGDFNADGINDLLYISYVSNQVALHVISTILDRNGSVIGLSHYVKADVARLSEPDEKKIFYGVGDLNSDGYSDIMLYFIDKNLIKYQALTFSRDGVDPHTQKEISKGAIPEVNFTSQLTDLNGDGNTDLFFTWVDDKGWYTRSYIINNSSQLGLLSAQANERLSSRVFNYDINTFSIDTTKKEGQQISSEIILGDYSRLGNIMLADVNRDGNIDITISDTNDKGWEYYCAIGKGNGEFVFLGKGEISSEKFERNYRSNFGDFNGDGNLDLIIQKTSDSGWYVLTAYGNGRGIFQLKEKDIKLELLLKRNFSYSQVFQTDHVLPYYLRGYYKRIFDEKLKLINSCTDLDKYECVMSNIRMIFPVETGFYPDNVTRPFSSAIKDPLRNFIKTDLNLENNVKRIIAAELHGDSLQSDIFGTYKFYTRITYGDYWQPYVIDLDGDGVSDILLSYPLQVPSDKEASVSASNLEKGTHTFVFLNKTKRVGQIAQIRHSNKSKTLVEYSSTLNSRNKELKATLVAYPFVQFNSPIQCVSHVRTSNGIGRDSMNATHYTFSGGLFSLEGRGFLGFEEQKVTNAANGNYAVKRAVISPLFMHHGFLPTGRSETFIEGFLNPVSIDTYDYELRVGVSRKLFNTYCIKHSSSTFDLYGINTGLSTTESIYDSFGNLSFSRTRTGDQSSDHITNEVKNAYYEQLGNSWEQEWLLGRLQTANVKTTRGGATSNRIARFEYDAATGQLVKETSDVQDTTFSLTKEYVYNKYGNIHKSLLYPTYNRTDESTRTTTSEFTSDNRFVYQSVDAAQYIVYKKSDPITGQIVSTTESEKGNTISIEADPLGRTQRVLSSDVTPDLPLLENSTETRICNDCEFSAISSYFTISSGSETNTSTISYFGNSDKLVRTVSFDFRDRKIITEYTYDAAGNLVKASNPYFEGGRKNYTQYRYDRLNRKIAAVMPDGTTIDFRYHGLVDTVVNAKKQLVVSQKNMLGELVRSIDDRGFSLFYTYDLYGRTVGIVDSEGKKFAMVYDINNKRTSYSNPNCAGTEVSEYDAFGQKVSSVDPNGNKKEYQYDKAGRLLVMFARKSGSNERIEYTYIQQNDPEPGKGKLKHIKSYSDDHPIDENFEYYANGSLRRHTYSYFNLRTRLGSSRGNVFTYSGSKTKDNLVYTYTYEKGKVKTITYPFTGSNEDKKFTVRYDYHGKAVVKASGQTENGPNLKFWELLNSNAHGLTTHYMLGDSIVSRLLYDNIVSNLTQIQYFTKKEVIAGANYGYDNIGNLIYRSDELSHAYDSIFYDQLNRVIEVRTAGYSTTLGYYADGGIKQKKFGTDLKYDFTYLAGSNRYASIQQTDLQTKLVSLRNSFSYDNAGNELSTFPYAIRSRGETIFYNQYNLPYSIGNLRFYYSFAGEKSAIYNFGRHEGTVYLEGLSEFVYSFDKNDNNGRLAYQKINIRVNGSVIANYYTSSGQVDYILKDALNTPLAIANSKGKVVTRLAFDIWGTRRDPKTWQYNWAVIAGALSDTKTRGFINSNTFDGIGLIDFSARLYNPITGRFVGVDPIVSNALSRTQFTNSYTYGYNNPTVFVDSNGKFGFIVVVVAAAYLGASAAGGSLLPWDWNDNWWKGALVGVASVAGGYLVAGPALFTGGMSAGTAVLSGAAGGFAGGFTATLVNGGNFSQALESGFKGGIIGGVTAGVSYGIGGSFAGSSSNGSYLGKATLHGLSQGTASVAMDGSFEHGFLAGSFSSIASPLSNIKGLSSEQQVLIAAAVGGSASSIGGGKFANGALSGAMVHVYNHKQHENQNLRQKAFEQWKNGRGETLVVDATEVNLCGVSASRFTHVGASIRIRTLFYDPMNYPALGSVTIMYAGDNAVSIRDHFDFNPHDLSKATGALDYGEEVLRNIETAIGREIIGPGEKFKFNFRGVTPIDCYPKHVPYSGMWSIP